ncbi:MAG: LemA family protein [Actinobacteria bacterium]|nr:LemA family protein [Actinomycetota bacterium]
MSALLFVLLIVMLVMVWYLSFTATRLDRLHHRVETSWGNLDAALKTRSALALEIARSNLVDPATSMLLLAAAHVAVVAEQSERADAEEELSQLLLSLLEEKALDSDGEIFRELNSARDRLRIAITLHLEAVSRTQAQRKRPIVRIFRLAGRAPLPVKYPFEEIQV